LPFTGHIVAYNSFTFYLKIKILNGEEHNFWISDLIPVSLLKKMELLAL